jgi:hypothetical protein
MELESVNVVLNVPKGGRPRFSPKQIFFVKSPSICWKKKDGGALLRHVKKERGPSGVAEGGPRP